MFRLSPRARGARTIAAVAALVLLPVRTTQAQFTSLTFFGDSYSDTGNADILAPLAGLGDPTPPPFFNGRFSDGPVWVEYLASALGRPQNAAPVFLAGPGAGNYAIGGARAAVWPGEIIPTSGAQIARYFSFAGAADPTGLYALFSGGNDLRAAGGLATDAERRAATLAAAQAVAVQAGALSQGGARSILVPYLANVGLFPEALLVPGRTAILTELTTLYNQTLAQGIAQLRLQYPTTTFYDLRLDNLLTNIRSDALSYGGATYGITNVAVPCFTLATPACATSLFVDGQHPTTVGHRAIAGAALNLVVNGVNVSTVPEPTTVVLLGGGLLLLTGAAARRRARQAAAPHLTP